MDGDNSIRTRKEDRDLYESSRYILCLPHRNQVKLFSSLLPYGNDFAERQSMF